MPAPKVVFLQGAYGPIDACAIDEHIQPLPFRDEPSKSLLHSGRVAHVKLPAFAVQAASGYTGCSLLHFLRTAGKYNHRSAIGRESLRHSLSYALASACYCNYLAGIVILHSKHPPRNISLCQELRKAKGGFSRLSRLACAYSRRAYRNPAARIRSRL